MTSNARSFWTLLERTAKAAGDWASKQCVESSCNGFVLRMVGRQQVVGQLIHKGILDHPGPERWCSHEMYPSSYICSTRVIPEGEDFLLKCLHCVLTESETMWVGYKKGLLVMKYD